MVLFEPDREVYKDMMQKLEWFKPYTEMAEQEFLSWYWGRYGDMWAIQKKNNFQLHQTYFQVPKTSSRTKDREFILLHVAKS